MKWTLVDKAKDISYLMFVDGVIFDAPAWVNDEGTAILNHCSEGGIQIHLYPEDDEREDGAWAPNLDQAFIEANRLLQLMEEK